MDLEKIYSKLPIPLQQLACNFEGWRTVQKNYGGRFKDFLKEAESRSFWTKEQIQAFRDQRLRAFIRHCWETVPFYRRKFKETKISPEDIKTLNDLAVLPILTKEDVQDNFKELVSKAVPEGERVLIKTSGTTGGAIHFYSTKQAIQEQWATWWRYRRWHGIQMDTLCAYFTGRPIVPLHQSSPPFWRYNYPGHKIHFSAYHMNPNNLPAYIGELRRRRPPWIHGYPSLVSLLASYVLETGADLGYEVRWVTIGSENLMPQQSELIHKAFGVKPIQNYGSEEAVANFSECEYGCLHVDEDFAAVRFIPSPEGIGYKVIGTNFSNFATPLLNYDVQDNVTLANNITCQCNRPGRIIKNIDGRMEDYIILKNGTKLGRLEHAFTNFLNIREAQIIQKSYGEIMIRIVKGPMFSEVDEISLKNKMMERLGKDIKISIDYVEKLERSQTGKLRFVVSLIAEGKLI